MACDRYRSFSEQFSRVSRGTGRKHLAASLAPAALPLTLPRGHQLYNHIIVFGLSCCHWVLVRLASADFVMTRHGFICIQENAGHTLN
jgi:hypothetical protein